MKLIIATECRFLSNEQGIVCSDNGTRGYSFWDRYLDVMEAVTVIGRLCAGQGPAMAAVEGPGVRFTALAHYVGPWQYLRQRKLLSQAMSRICADGNVYIARCPGAIGSMMAAELRRSNYPYGVEVVGDPYDIFAPGAVRHPLRPLFRFFLSRQLRRVCRGACAVAYVTENALQRRYPASPGAFTTHYSSVELPSEAFVPEARSWVGRNQFRLVNVGSMAQTYKAQDVLIEALAFLVAAGLDIRLSLVGDGRYRTKFEELARSKGIADNVDFLGQLPGGAAVRAELDRSDLFVLPSHTEGLPRAMIEAMARGLPCVGSAVGGIPELIGAECLVPRADSRALATKIREVITDPVLMAKMSARNLAKAVNYGNEILRNRRIEFYSYLGQKTEEWLAANRSRS